ncbi:hypothetical protein JA1_000557 [Spathaspora sp. JA1]|nr:hypothetical protein JA1_000557 [Spathaspora sp. JA1]
MVVAITNKSSFKEAPFTEEYIVDLINQHILLDNKQLIAKLGEILSHKSSKHKFIIQFTNVSNIDSDLNIDSNFASVWDSTKDGCITNNNKKMLMYY